MDSISTSPYKSPGGIRHAQSLDNLSWAPTSPKKNLPARDQGSRGKANLASRTFDNVQNMNEEDMVNSLNESASQAHGSTDDLVSAGVRPFNNNPPLPTTQRDIVGNNLHFNTSSARNDWLEQENDQLAALLLYRDTLKRNLTTAARAGGGLPKMRHGRIGSQWRHIKQTNTYSGSNLMFVDGTVRIDDTFKYPIPRFGYPPLQRPQHQFSSSQNDLSNINSKSLDAATWSFNNSHRLPASNENLNWLTETNSSKAQMNQSFDATNFHEVKESAQDRTRHGLR